MALRKGLLNELADVFDAADEMVGCGDPATFEQRREAIRNLQLEVNRLLIEGDRYNLRRHPPRSTH